jgi:hypothetical protein
MALGFNCLDRLDGLDGLDCQVRLDGLDPHFIAHLRIKAQASEKLTYFSTFGYLSKAGSSIKRFPLDFLTRSL